MVQQDPSPRAVWTVLKIDLERIMAINPDDSRTIVPEQMLKLCSPLGMCGSAKSESMGEQSGPVIAGCGVRIVVEAFSPEVFDARFAVPEMGISPVPSSESFFGIRAWLDADFALVKASLCCLQSLEVRTSQFSRIPGVISGNLRIANARRETGGKSCTRSKH